MGPASERGKKISTDRWVIMHQFIIMSSLRSVAASYYMELIKQSR
jgi:hypothetical protein